MNKKLILILGLIAVSAQAMNKHKDNSTLWTRTRAYLFRGLGGAIGDGLLGAAIGAGFSYYSQGSQNIKSVALKGTLIGAGLGLARNGAYFLFKERIFKEPSTNNTLLSNITRRGLWGTVATICGANIGASIGVALAFYKKDFNPIITGMKYGALTGGVLGLLAGPIHDKELSENYENLEDALADATKKLNFTWESENLHFKYGKIQGKLPFCYRACNNWSIAHLAAYHGNIELLKQAIENDAYHLRPVTFGADRRAMTIYDVALVKKNPNEQAVIAAINEAIEKRSNINPKRRR